MQKLKFILLIIFPVIIFSCKKENSSTPKLPGKNYAVKFNITNFAQQKGAFSIHKSANGLTTNSLIDVNNYLDVLYYYVFDSDKNLVKRIAQDSTMSTFGTVTDSLPAGHYSVFIAAGKKGLVTGGTDYESTYVTYSSYSWQDMFTLYNYDLTVAADNITRDLTLKRVVSKLELNILDAIPQQADSLILTISPEIYDYNLQFEGPGGTIPFGIASISKFIPASAKGTTNFTLDKIVGNTLIACTVKISCKDASNHVIASATANNVVFTPNTKTILSGNLFNNIVQTDGQTFNVKIDTAWASTPSIVHF